MNDCRATGANQFRTDLYCPEAVANPGHSKRMRVLDEQSVDHPPLVVDVLLSGHDLPSNIWRPRSCGERLIILFL
jgi:hypothetical protein